MTRNARNPFPPGALVAAYLRDSGGDKQELSVPRQEGEFRRWCAESGLVAGRVFKDEARPGSSVVARVQFQAMMHYFRSGDAPEVGLVIWNYQRFAREIDDSQFFRADIRRRGYLFHSLNDDVPEGSMGRVYEALLDWKNEQFLVDLSADIKSGLRVLVERYGALPGTPPRGFRREPVEISTHRDGRPRIVNRWAPDPALTEQVRQAFELLLAGAPLAEILRTTRLYNSVNSFATFFRNPLYKGVLEYGDLVIEDYCEPVVSPEVWDQAQAILAARAGRRHLAGDNPQHPRRAASPYILSGLLYCARCGAPLSGSTERATRPDGYVYRYERYVCSGQRRRRDCDAEALPKLWLEAMLLRTLAASVLEPDNLALQQTIALETEVERQGELTQQAQGLRATLAGVRRRIANITETLAEDGRSRALLAKLAELEADEGQLLSDLARLDAEAAATLQPMSGAEIDAVAARLRLILADGDLEEVRHALRGLVRRIVVERVGDRVTTMIEYWFPPASGPPEEITLISPASVGAHGKHIKIAARDRSCA
jgi:DNA invertase Pin-like site-specific DNA recombinase